MPVLSLPADESFVHLNDTHELAEVLIRQPSADTVAHVPSGAIGTEAHETVDLKGANALLAGHHQMDDPKPVPHRLVRILEHCPDQHGEAVAVRLTSPALPMERLCRDGMNFHVTAAGAVHSLGPAIGREICPAGILMREHGLELRDG